MSRKTRGTPNMDSDPGHHCVQSRPPDSRLLRQVLVAVSGSYFDTRQTACMAGLETGTSCLAWFTDCSVSRIPRLVPVFFGYDNVARSPAVSAYSRSPYERTNSVSSTCCLAAREPACSCRRSCIQRSRSEPPAGSARSREVLMTPGEMPVRAPRQFPACRGDERARGKRPGTPPAGVALNRCQTCSMVSNRHAPTARTVHSPAFTRQQANFQNSISPVCNACLAVGWQSSVPAL